MASCAHDAAPAYEPRRPQESVLHRLLMEHLETLVAQAREGDEAGQGLPAYAAQQPLFWGGERAAGGRHLRTAPGGESYHRLSTTFSTRQSA